MNKQYLVDGKFVDRDTYLKSKEKAIAASQTDAESKSASKSATKEVK